ncbi:hypothetical protein CPC08DRAFT_761570 [Agrocybe pediades]|nr:hypothetical protein CPC08DRAFT_761570 [Agrocybe pediades]
MKVDPGTYGAILLGALIASSLSGIFCVQCIIYFKNYPRDNKYLKGFVSSLFFLLLLFVAFVMPDHFADTYLSFLGFRSYLYGGDISSSLLGFVADVGCGRRALELLHTGLVWVSMWDSFIDHFGAVHYVDHIPPSVALTVVLTAALTFLTHGLFAHRMYHLSERRKVLPAIVMLLALFRLAAASVSGGEMIHLQSYTRFRQQFRWLFSLGLSLSSAVDILITLAMFYLLRKRRKHSIALHSMIDILILYTFEIGSLTSAATVASLLCWSTLDNLIFLGLHFVIGKLYANSLLATLNSRNELRRAHSNAIDLMQFNIPHIASDNFQALPEDSEENFIPKTPVIPNSSNPPTRPSSKSLS